MITYISELVAVNLSLVNTGAYTSLPAQILEYLLFSMFEWAHNKAG